MKVIGNKDLKYVTQIILGHVSPFLEDKKMSPFPSFFFPTSRVPEIREKIFLSSLNGQEPIATLNFSSFSIHGLTTTPFLMAASDITRFLLYFRIQ